MRAPGSSVRPGQYFLMFWCGQTFSAVGDAMALVAVPLLVLGATGSVTQMGAVAAVSGVGQIVGGVIAGPLVDRVDRRRLMIVCDCLRAIVYGAVPLLWWLVGPHLWLIYGVACVGAFLGMCFSVAYITAIPALVAADRVVEANGRLQASVAVASLIGPILAGVVTARTGAIVALGADALTFLASALSLAWVRFRSVSRSVTAGTTAVGVVAELLEGVRFLWRHSVLRALTAMITGFSFFTLAATDLIIYHLAHDLRQPSDTVGFVFGVASLGAVAGGLLAAPARRRWGFGVCYLGGACAEGAVLVALGAAPALALVAPLLIGYTFCEIFKGVNSIALRQQVTPDYLLGRVTATFWTINGAPGPFGAAVLTAIAERVGASVVLMGVGLAFMVIAFVGTRSPVAACH